MRSRVIGVVMTAFTLGGLIAVAPATPASAAHYCTAATGTLVNIPLPANPADPTRTNLYIHDRARTTGTGLTGNPADPGDDTEGTWVYLENRKAAGYNTGGVPIVVVLGPTGSNDTPCGATADDLGFGQPKAGADDVIF